MTRQRYRPRGALWKRKMRFVFVALLCIDVDNNVQAFQPTCFPRTVLQRTAVNRRKPSASRSIHSHENVLKATLRSKEKESPVIIDSSIEAGASTLPQPSDDFGLDSKTSSAETTMLVDSSSLDESDEQHNQKALLIMIVLCWGVACLSALDRVAMSVAILPMAQEFGYTETIKGQISSLFSTGYGLAILPSGLLISYKPSSPRLVLGSGILLWSLATLATPLVAGRGDTEAISMGASSAMLASTTLLPLLLSRAAVGASEAVLLPSLQRLMSNWIDPGQKSLAVAGIFSGFQAGTVIAYLVSPIVMDQAGGWRRLFYTYGGLGLLWLVPWLILARDSPEPLSSDKSIVDTSTLDASTPAPLNILKPSETCTTSVDTANKASWQETSIQVLKTAPWKEFLSSRAFWAMMLAHAANNWGLYNNLSWSPTFYAEQYGLNVKDSAWLSVLPSVTGAVCGLVAGALADSIITKMEQQHNGMCNEEVRTKIRRVFQGISLYGPATLLCLMSWHIPEHPWVAQCILMATVGLQAFNAAGYGAANQEKAGEKWTGLLYSFTSLPGVMVGSLGVYVTGQVLDATGQDWSTVFCINALVNVIGATAFVTLYDSKREWD